MNVLNTHERNHGLGVLIGLIDKDSTASRSDMLEYTIHDDMENNHLGTRTV